MFVKAYVAVAHMFDMFQRGVSRVTCARHKLQYRVVRKRTKRPEGEILPDDEREDSRRVSLPPD
jgi:hypothetical protein